MQPFTFRVVGEDGDAGIPIAVAGQTIVDLQNLITHIGRNIVRTDLRLQNAIPDIILDKFVIRTGGQSKEGLGTSVPAGADMLIDDALAELSAALDFFGTGASGAWMETKFLDSFERGDVARWLSALAEHVSGYRLLYGEKGEKVFTKLNQNRLQEYFRKGNSARGYAIGSVSPDPKNKGRWLFRNSPAEVPITLSKGLSVDLTRRLSGDHIVLVRGTIRKNGDDEIIGIDNADLIEEMRHIAFRRIIAADSDVVLTNAADAIPTYSSIRNAWRLVYEPLGIDVTKDSWDGCVMAFHDYFAFLWKRYVESGEEFTGEEKDVKDTLIMMGPAA